jgi:small conductance mechanosensitive channel
MGKWETMLCQFLKDLVYAAGMTFVFIAVLAKLGIQTASFIAVLGAAGLAVGMALQGSLSNFAAGVLIVVFRPYKVGDFVKAGGEAGTVQEVQIFNTVLSSPDNVRIVVPNAQITSGSITNYSTNSTRRVDLVASISYSDDIRKAKQVLQKVVAAEPRVLKDPAPVIAVVKLGDSSVDLVVRPWVKSTDYWDAYFALTENIKLELEKNGITIPFPQRHLHVYSHTAAPNPVASAGMD